MTTEINKLRGWTLALIVALAAAAVAVLGAGGADAGVTPSEPPAAFAANPQDTTDPGSVFAVLKRAPTAEDRDNAAIVLFGQEEPWVKVAGARVVQTTAQGRVWLTPTTDGRVCLSLETKVGTSHTCDTLERVKTIGIVLGSAAGDKQKVVLTGMVPDATETATLVVDGAAQKVAAGQVFQTPAGLGSLTVTGPDKSYKLELK